MPCPCGIEISRKCMSAIGLSSQMAYIGNENIQPPTTKDGALSTIKLYENMLAECDDSVVLKEAIRAARERVDEYFGKNG